MSFFVYILQSVSSSRFYIGSTKNIENRLIEHNSGETVSTKNKGPWVLRASYLFPTLSDARRFERKLKSFKNHKYIEKFISNV